MSEVEYRLIEGFPGYRVGNDGTVWTCFKRVGRKIDGKSVNGTMMVIGDKWALRATQWSGRKRTHLTVILHRKGRKPIHKYIHHLVLLAFVGPRTEGCEACHKDGDASNNTPGNLYWGTSSQNKIDAINHGTLKSVKYSNEDLCKVLLMQSEGVRQCDIVKATGFPQQWVSKVMRGQIGNNYRGSRHE